MRNYFKRYLSTIAIIALVLISWQRVDAATVTSLKDVLTDSRPSIVTNHVISWLATDAIAEGDTVTITFDSDFDTSSIVEDDVDVSASTKGELTTAANCSAAEAASVAMAADVLTITPCAGDFGADIGSGETVTVEIGTNATSSGTGSHQITSPVAGSYTIEVGGTGYTGTGSLQVAIVAGTSHAVTVAASLSVAVAGVNDGSVNGATIDETDTDATSITFSSGNTPLTVNTQRVAAQSITVSTNAADGYTSYIRVVTSGASGVSDVLSDGGTNNCDGFSYNTASNASPQTWAAGTNPSGSTANSDTCWYGYTTEDTTLASGSSRFDSNKWAPLSTVAGEVAYDGAPVNAQVTNIGYQIEANALQPMGVYTGTTEFITTAIF